MDFCIPEADLDVLFTETSKNDYLDKKLDVINPDLFNVSNNYSDFSQQIRNLDNITSLEEVHECVTVQSRKHKI